jgi:hypothetical protein
MNDEWTKYIPNQTTTSAVFERCKCFYIELAVWDIHTIKHVAYKLPLQTR